MISPACPYPCPYECPCRKGRSSREEGNEYKELPSPLPQGCAAANATRPSPGLARVAQNESVGRGDRGPIHADGGDASPPHAQPYANEHSQAGHTTGTRPRCSCPRTQAIKARPVPRSYAFPTGHDLRARIPASVTAPRGSRLGLRCRALRVAAGRVCTRLVVHGGSARTIAAVRRLVTKFHGQEARGTGGGAARIHAEAMTGPVAATPRKRAARPDRAEGLALRAPCSERSNGTEGGRRTFGAGSAGPSPATPPARNDTEPP